MNSRDLAYYKSLNYRVEIFYNREEECWFAEIPELWGALTDASTPDEALQKAFKLKEELLEAAFRDGRTIPQPRPEIEYSGRFLLRVPKSLHKRLADEAEEEGTSINRLAIQILSEELARRQTMSAVTDAISDQVREQLATAQILLTTVGPLQGNIAPLQGTLWSPSENWEASGRFYRGHLTEGEVAAKSLSQPPRRMPSPATPREEAA